MSLVEYAKRAAVRKVVYVVIGALLAALFALFGGDAKAQDYSNCNNTAVDSAACATGSEAASATKAVAAARLAGMGWSTGRVCPLIHVAASQGVPARYEAHLIDKAYPCSSVNYAQRTITREYYGARCPAGTTWNDALQKCQTQCDVGEWEDPNNPGSCLNPSVCYARNGTDLTAGLRTGPSTTWCEGGCKVQFTKGKSYGVGVDGKYMWTGEVSYPGSPCSGVTPVGGEPQPPAEGPEVEAPKKNPDECTPIEGQTACVKPDGNLCAKSTTGKEFCWSPHSTGEKTSANEIQTKTPTPGPDTLQLSNGDTANKTSTTTVETKTTGGQSSTTSVNNYTTTSGANAPKGKDGGASDSQPGEEEGEEDGSASGGESCDQPPVCTSKDPATCAIFRQQWLARCDAESRAKDLQSEAESAASEDDGSAILGQQTLFSDLFPNELNLDAGGLGFGRDCPTPPALGGIELDFSGVCMVLSALGLLFMAAGYVQALYIIAEN